MAGNRFLSKARALSETRLPLLMCVVGAVAGTALGLLGRRLLAKSNAAAAVQASAVSEILPGRSSHQGSPARSAGSGKAGADAILTALAGDKGVDYWLHLLAAADGSSAGVLARLVDSLKDEPSALSLLGERWAQLDPAGMFAALKAQGLDKNHFDSSSPPGNELEKILAREWFQQNPDALIAALSATDGPRHLPTAKEELLHLLSAKDPGQTLKLIVNWELPIQTISSKVLAPWLRANPREAMNLILARKNSVLWPGDQGSGTLWEIARNMADIDPVGTLSQPFAANGSLQPDILDQVMKAWAGRDPAAAADWLAGDGVDQKKRNRLSHNLLQVWSATDARAASAWADSHVTGSARRNANYALIPALAAQDSAGALEFVSQMSPGFTRDEAVLLVTDSLLNNKGKEEALANFQRITALSDPALRTGALEHAAWRMMKAAPQEFLAWLATPEGSEAPFHTFTTTADSLAEKDGAAAMKWAAGLKADITGEVRQSVLSKWMEQNPEAAKAWVGTLPAGPERRTSVTSATGFLASRISLENYTGWLDSLPSADHPAVLAGLAKVTGLDPGTRSELMAKYK